MEITAKRDHDGLYILETGPVSFELPQQALESLQKLVSERLEKATSSSSESLKRKISTYRNLATKMITVDDRILQSFLPQATPEQLVTLVRLAEGERLFHKVMRNMSRQNGQQFQQDYQDLNQITEHQACLYMEQIVPMIKKAAQAQKEMLAQSS
uniref:Flagellar motor switch protein FliG C-terminal domain-containing protein n=1 Tax=Hydrogenovibrio crunogenus (strain DSM 25203 / XCL-2) TaxID=317025 RepID=Q31EL8_HYDCU